jgi:hypothetical protein
MNPGDLPIPAIFDPIFTYLADTLPPPLYNFILNFLSHCLALLYGFSSLLASLLSKSPSEWDVQTLLPPLISLLAAYLALASIYRTTTWMIRTTFCLMKWGIILGVLVAGMCWYIGVTQTGGGVNGLLSHLGHTALEMFNGYSRNALGGERNSQSRTTSTRRPKPWESFNHHREWQYREDQTETDQGSDLKTLFDNLMGVTGQLLREDSQWWLAMKRMMESASDESGQAAEESSGRTRSNTGSKSRSR